MSCVNDVGHMSHDWPSPELETVKTSMSEVLTQLNNRAEVGMYAPVSQ